MRGVESPRPGTLERYRKGIEPNQALEAVRLLKANGIFSHTMLIIGDREDTHESVAQLRSFVSELDPDFTIYTALMPFPGTEVYDQAKERGEIEGDNLFT